MIASVRPALFAALLVAGPAVAEDTAAPAAAPAVDTGGSISRLLSEGYEIKAAVPNGARYIVFLQKDQSAVACEFVSLTKSRCGAIN